MTTSPITRGRLGQFLFALAVSVVLFGCGGSGGSPTQADLSNASEIQTEQVAGATPFISFLRLNGIASDNIGRIRFRVEPKPGSASRAVQAEYARAYLLRRGYIDAAQQGLTVPVFGLYAGHDNTVRVVVTFTDSSQMEFSVSMQTPAYADPAQLYDRPRIVKARTPGADLGFDFFMMKPAAAPPLVIDTDGDIRWVGVGVSAAQSSTFQNNGFVVGEETTTRFRRLELDGTFSDAQLADASYTHFHHSIDQGRDGLLAQVDAVAGGVENLESIVFEFSNDGSISKEWNFERIIADHMRSNGDDPASFVRPGVDWFHSNATTYDPSDNSLIVSSRENFLIKVDYDSAEIKWILGDPSKHWYSFPSLRAKALQLEAGGLYPIGQHSVSVDADGQVTVFNNGAASFNQPVGAPAGETRSFSVVSTYAIDAVNRTAREVERFENNRSLFSDICSSAYEGRDNSMLVTYSVAEGRTKLRAVGLDTSRQIQFDFEYPTTVCETSWNTAPIAFDSLRFEN